jgi:peptidoglycan/xylan/chitin deacetylase (PgdA/CDA1 family)
MFTTESYEAILKDIQNGSAQLGKAFSNDTVRTKYLAYPFGHYNQITIQAAQDAGMRLAFTTMTGNVKLKDSPYELKRQGIAPYHSMEDFIKKLEGTYK